MLGFWPSDAVLLLTQAGLVCGPRPEPPPPLLRLRAGIWAWLMPVSLGSTIAVLAVAPTLGTAYAWVALIVIPILAVPACYSLVGFDRSCAGGSAAWLALAAVVVGVLLAVSSGRHGYLAGEAAAVAVTALSACTLASYLAALAPVPWLKVGVMTMAALDAFLVFGDLLQGPNRTLETATAGAQLPQFQVADFGSAVIGYGDLFIAAVLGSILASDRALRLRVPRWQGAVLVLGCAAAFDVLFLDFDVLPATVPVAVALLILDARERRRRLTATAS